MNLIGWPGYRVFRPCSKHCFTILLLDTPHMAATESNLKIRSLSKEQVTWIFFVSGLLLPTERLSAVDGITDPSLVP